MYSLLDDAPLVSQLKLSRTRIEYHEQTALNTSFFNTEDKSYFIDNDIYLFWHNSAISITSCN